MSDNFLDSSSTSNIQWTKDFSSNPAGVPPISDSDQFMRKIALTISGSTAENTELSFTPSWNAKGPFEGRPQHDIRIVWRVDKTTNQSPNLLSARIFNLHPKTMARAITYTKVELSAGYQTGRFGGVFKGTIVQWRRGKETPVDTYLELLAGDGDLAHNYDIVSKQWDAGTTNEQQIKDAAGALKGMNQEISVGQVIPGDYGSQKLLRSRSFHGMACQLLRTHSNVCGADWWIDDGQVHFIERRRYLPGDTPVLTPRTGLIGMPEVTPEGIQIRCLLNPYLRLGGLVKVDTDLLSGVPFLPGSQTQLPISPQEAPSGILKPTATMGAQLSNAFTSPTGTYKILLLEHSGDTRGNPWYSDMVCIAAEATSDLMFKSVDIPYKRVWGGIGLGSGPTPAPGG